MQRHLVRVPAFREAQRPAKVVVLEVRRQARLQAIAPQPRPPKRAA
jgi:hypothetical protein